MVDFLLQDGVCESLMDFITQVNSPFPRPAPSDAHTDELKKAYRAVLLLSPEHPSDALNAFLSKKAHIISRKIFEVRYAEPTHLSPPASEPAQQHQQQQQQQR